MSPGKPNPPRMTLVPTASACLVSPILLHVNCGSPSLLSPLLRCLPAKEATCLLLLLPPLPSLQAEQPDITPAFLHGAGICAWINISPGSLGAVTQRMGGGHLNCHGGSAAWSQPCQHHGSKLKPPTLPSPCLEDSSPSTRHPLFPHHHTLEKLFRPNPKLGEAPQTKL